MNVFLSISGEREYIFNQNNIHASLIPYNGKIILKDVVKVLLEQKDINIFIIADISLDFCNLKNVNVISNDDFFMKKKEANYIYINCDYYYDSDDLKEFCTFCYEKNENVLCRYKSKDYSDIFYYKARNTSAKCLYKIKTEPTLIDEKFIFDFNVCKEKYPLDDTLIGIFKRTVKINSTKRALTCGEYSLTYLELDELTDKISSNILNMGYKSGSCVGILMKRSAEYIITMISVLKANMTYIPLTYLYPLERIRNITVLSNMKLVITDKYDSLYDELDCKQIVYSILTEAVERRVSLYNNSIAYILFTSGSSGNPKGVKITQRNIINNAFFLHNKVFLRDGLNPQKFGVIADFVFDMSVQQIYPALLFGKELVIFPSEMEKTPKYIDRYFDQVNTSDITPTHLEILLEYYKKSGNFNKKSIHIVIGGEKLTKGLCEKFFGLLPDSYITNIYGPTECTVEVSIFKLYSNNIVELKDIPIGYPVDNSRLYVLDKDCKFVPEGCQGIIYASGECVGDGYISINSDAYTTDILDNNVRMYNTGDIGYWKEGMLYYIGRNDSQVKINGYRIDLGEIERVLETNSRIIRAFINIVHDKNNNKKIVAYFMGEDVELKSLTKYLAKYLPYYMIPSFFVPVDYFHTNINGKIDLSKLPELSESLTVFEEDIEVSLNGAINYLNTLLGLKEDDRKCLSETLTSVGLSSIQIIEFLSFIEEKYDVKISLREAYSDLSIIEIARKVLVSADSKTVEEYKYRKSYKCLPMQKYVLEMNQYLDDDLENFILLNRMIFMYTLTEGTHLERLKRAISEACLSTDAFNVFFRFAHNNSKAFYNPNADIVIKCEKINSVSEKYAYLNNKEYLLAQNNNIYFTILMYMNEPCAIILNVNHMMFDYISSLSLMKRINIVYNGGNLKRESFLRLMDYLSKLSFNEMYNSDLNYIDDYLKKSQMILQEQFGNSNIFNDDTKEFFAIQKSYNKTTFEKILYYSNMKHKSVYSVLLTLYLISVCKACSWNEMTITIILNGRSNITPSDAIGYFSKTCYFNFRLSDDFDEMNRDVYRDIKKLESVDYLIDINEINVNTNGNFFIFDYLDYDSIVSSKTLFKSIHYCDNNFKDSCLSLRIQKQNEDMCFDFCSNGKIRRIIIDEIINNYYELIHKYM